MTISMNKIISPFLPQKMCLKCRTPAEEIEGSPVYKKFSCGEYWLCQQCHQDDWFYSLRFSGADACFCLDEQPIYLRNESDRSTEGFVYRCGHMVHIRCHRDMRESATVGYPANFCPFCRHPMGKLERDHLPFPDVVREGPLNIELDPEPSPPLEPVFYVPPPRPRRPPPANSPANPPANPAPPQPQPSTSRGRGRPRGSGRGRRGSGSTSYTPGSVRPSTIREIERAMRDNADVFLQMMVEEYFSGYTFNFE